MKYHRVSRAKWEALSDARLATPISAYTSETIRYWAKRGGTIENDTAGLKLCVDRGDPFAKRLWAKIIAERLH